MQVHYTGRNIDVTPALKTFLEEKLQRLEHRKYNIEKINIIFQYLKNGISFLNKNTI